MTADELRELANAIEPMACAPRFDGLDMPALTAYLRACADALDAGPVAWHYDGRDQIEVYPLAMPAQAQALRLPEPMTDEEVAALIDETEYLPTDHAVRYLVETGECRVKEANDAAAAPTPPAQDDEALEVLRELMLWIENWGCAFHDDPEWPETDAKVRALLTKRGAA